MEAIKNPITQTIADKLCERNYFDVKNYIGNVCWEDDVEIVEARVSAESGTVSVKMYCDPEYIDEKSCWRLEYVNAYLDTDMASWAEQTKLAIEDMMNLIKHVKGDVVFH